MTDADVRAALHALGRIRFTAAGLLAHWPAKGNRLRLHAGSSTIWASAWLPAEVDRPTVERAWKVPADLYEGFQPLQCQPQDVGRPLTVRGDVLSHPALLPVEMQPADPELLPSAAVGEPCENPPPSLLFDTRRYSAILALFVALGGRAQTWTEHDDLGYAHRLTLVSGHATALVRWLESIEPDDLVLVEAELTTEWTSLPALVKRLAAIMTVERVRAALDTLQGQGLALRHRASGGPCCYRRHPYSWEQGQ